MLKNVEAEDKLPRKPKNEAVKEREELLGRGGM